MMLWASIWPHRIVLPLSAQQNPGNVFWDFRFSLLPAVCVFACTLVYVHACLPVSADWTLKLGLGKISIYIYILDIILDFVILSYGIRLVFSCVSLFYLPCSTCLIICLYPLSQYIHFTDDYLSKISLCKYLAKTPMVICTSLRGNINVEVFGQTYFLCPTSYDELTLCPTSALPAATGSGCFVTDEGRREAGCGLLRILIREIAKHVARKRARQSSGSCCGSVTWYNSEALDFRQK